MLVELEEDNLDTVLAGHDTVMVQFSATWCGNCRLMKPKFKRMASENEAITFVVVDAEKFPNSRKLASVNNLPTFAGYKKGVLISQVQTNKEDILKNLLNEVASN
jgi:thiol-disulfide isomerase/thioredoxin